MQLPQSRAEPWNVSKGLVQTFDVFDDKSMEV